MARGTSPAYLTYPHLGLWFGMTPVAEPVEREPFETVIVDTGWERVQGCLSDSPRRLLRNDPL
jgi:hypothetical protein